MLSIENKLYSKVIRSIFKLQIKGFGEQKMSIGNIFGKPIGISELYIICKKVIL